MEWVRGWLFTGFPWLSLGYSQIDSPLNGFAPLLGVYGVSWMTVLTASLLAYAFNSLERVGHIVLVLVGVWGGGELLAKVSWTTKVDEPLEVALVQGNISQEFKWLSGYQIPSIERYLQLSQEHYDADLIIWPETAIPIFYHDATEFLQRLAARHIAYGTHFLIGVPVMNNEGAYFNGVASIGEQPGFYYKHHLVPFGEYIPFQSYFGNLLKLFDVPLSEFSAGSARQVHLTSAGQNIGVSICYEDAFGELVRNSLPAATILVNVSNDAWFGHSIAPHQHLEIARMRALENGRYLLRATNTGISAVIDAKGQVAAQAPQFEIVVLRDKVQPFQGITPYTYFGNRLVVILLFSSLLLGGFIEHSRLVRRSQ
jgi:apolipoprotein N-acyltransferase